MAEQTNQIIIEKARILTQDFGLLLLLWRYIINIVIKLFNLQSNQIIEFKTPHKAQFNEKPDVFYFYKWGYTAYIYNYTLNKKKLQAKI